MVPWVPGGCGGARLTAGPRVLGLGAEGVGADRGDGPPHQPAPRGNVDVHLRGPQEGLPWGGNSRNQRNRGVFLFVTREKRDRDNTNI